MPATRASAAAMHVLMRSPSVSTGPRRRPGGAIVVARKGPHPGSLYSPTLPFQGEGSSRGLLRRDALRGGAARLHHHLDGIVDALARVLDRGRQILEREGVGVHFRRVEALLR